MAMTVQEISNALGLSVPAPDMLLQYLTTDSRQIAFGPATVFTALVTARRNGHHFIAAAWQKGVRHFIVSEAPPAAFVKEGCFWQVPDTLQALQQLAAWHRQRFPIPVVGITGSNGKTIVKEWLYQMLQPDENVCRNPRSYNSQTGVALSLWQLGAEHTMGLFEAGISAPGEMDRLEKMIRPTWGIFTTLGAAHDEGFSSREEKIQEKWTLFRHCTAVICHTDDPAIQQMADTAGIHIISWGKNTAALYRVISEETTGRETLIGLQTGSEIRHFRIPFSDAASLENALHCIVTCLHLGMQAAVVNERLQQLHALHMRLEWKKGIHGTLLLNDSYSHDLTSLGIALTHLQQQAGNSRMMAILSDLPGQETETAYREMAQLLEQKNIARLVGIGTRMQQFQNLFAAKGIKTDTYPDTHSFIQQADWLLFEKSTLLIKGGRQFAFESITSAMQQQQHETVLEIHLGALQHNLRAWRGLLRPDTRIMVMLKAFGYGSTDAELGRWLQHHGADYLAVAYADEGIALRQGGVQLPIMVMNPEPGGFDQLVRYQLEPELYSTGMLDDFRAFAEAEGLQHYPVHIKLDTGMHRLGFEPSDGAALLQRLTADNLLAVKSVFTHLVASEDPDHDAFTLQQAQLFEAFCDRIAHALPYPFLRHAANTAGIVRHPFLHYSMVRLGIGLFGIGGIVPAALSLEPVSRLYTTVAQVKRVKAGETVGYGRHAVLGRDSIIATVRIGYADGYRRQLGNGVGYMLVHGQKAAVAGNVCMDMTMLDVTDIPGVKAGDRVEVFGPGLPVTTLAAQCQTIPYEIMTGINQRVKRVLLEE